MIWICLALAGLGGVAEVSSLWIWDVLKRGKQGILQYISSCLAVVKWPAFSANSCEAQRNQRICNSTGDQSCHVGQHLTTYRSARLGDLQIHPTTSARYQCDRWTPHGARLSWQNTAEAKAARHKNAASVQPSPSRASWLARAPRIKGTKSWCPNTVKFHPFFDFFA